MTDATAPQPTGSGAGLTEDHWPVLGVFAGRAGIVGCSCMDARQWRAYMNARVDRSTSAWRAHLAEQIAARTAALAAENERLRGKVARVEALVEFRQDVVFVTDIRAALRDQP